MRRVERSISETDVRAMVRLLGETVALDADHQARKRFLMNGLCNLVDADAWVYTLGCNLQPVGPNACDGFNGEEFSKYLGMLEDQKIGDASEPFLAAAKKRAALAKMRDKMGVGGPLIDPPLDAARALREANVGSFIVNTFPLDQDSVSAIVVYRHDGREPFTPREREIAHIILNEVPWLHMASSPEVRSTDDFRLYPQQRNVFNLLLEGWGRKAIADHLGLSENTVSGYARDIYRIFKVRSQPELMRRFLTRSSGG